MKRKIFGGILIALGAALVLAAFGIGGYYLWMQERSGEQAQQAMESLLQQIALAPSVDTTQPSQKEEESLPSGSPTAPDPEPDPLRPMPTVDIDGVDYIGYVQIPDLALTLPIIAESTKANLNIAPCCFYGTAYQNNLVIGGHNFPQHFGKLSTLGYGATITFADVEGNVFTYEVAECETIQGYEAAYLCSGDWDLSLYTCTPGGRARVVVRCARIS